MRAPRRITRLDDLWLFIAEVFEEHHRDGSTAATITGPGVPPYTAKGICPVLSALIDAKRISPALMRKATDQMVAVYGIVDLPRGGSRARTKYDYWWAFVRCWTCRPASYTGAIDRVYAALLLREMSA